MNPNLKFARIFAGVSLLMLSPAWGDVARDSTNTILAKSDMAKDIPKRVDRLYAEAQVTPPPPPPRETSSSECDEPGGRGPQHSMGSGEGRFGHGRFGQGRLAFKLSAMETEIGVRSNQLDAWRDFTDALLAVAAPMPRQQAEADEDEGPDAEDVAEDKTETPNETASDDKAKPFAPAQRLADRVIERGRKAEKLQKAIDALKTTLTPEQLDKVVALEARMRERWQGHGPRFGGGHGPREFGPREFGPRAGGFCARADAGGPPPHDPPSRRWH